MSLVIQQFDVVFGNFYTIPLHMYFLVYNVYGCWVRQSFMIFHERRKGGILSGDFLLTKISG